MVMVVETDNRTDSGSIQWVKLTGICGWLDVVEGALAGGSQVFAFNNLEDGSPTYLDEIAQSRNKLQRKRADHEFSFGHTEFQRHGSQEEILRETLDSCWDFPLSGKPPGPSCWCTAPSSLQPPAPCQPLRTRTTLACSLSYPQHWHRCLALSEGLIKTVE